MFLFCYKRKYKGSFYGIQDNASRHQTERNGKIIWPVFFQREQRNESELWDSLRPLYFAFDCTYISFHCSVHQNEQQSNASIKPFRYNACIYFYFFKSCWYILIFSCAEEYGLFLNGRGFSSLLGGGGGGVIIILYRWFCFFFYINLK